MASEIKEFAKRLKKVPREVTRGGKLTEVLGEEFCKELEGRIPVGLSPTLGGGNDSPSVISFKRNQSSVTPYWAGDQIYYLEFGTGSPAVGKYPDPTRMAESATSLGSYEPRPYGHSMGQYWALPPLYWKQPDIKADGEPGIDYYVTKGWEPYAPFYLTLQHFKIGGFKKVLEEEVHDIVESKL